NAGYATIRSRSAYRAALVRVLFAARRRANPMKYHHPLLTALAAAALLAAVLLAPVPPARAQEGACGDTVTVVAGDTLFSIARRCGTTVSALLVANPSITNPDILYAGTVLTIPGGDDVPAEDEPQVGIRRSEEHTSELQSRENLVCRLLLEKKKRISIH